MGVAVADVDADGDTDLMVVNLEGQTDSFYRNDGGFFSDRTGELGLATESRRFTRFGVGLIDFDNDGLLDLYLANGRVVKSAESLTDDPYAEPNMLHRGTADGRFEEVLPRGGTETLLVATSRAAAFGDVDNDGGVDVIVVNRDGPAYLLHNIVENRGHWIRFRVLGDHGRDAVGATVSVLVDGRRIHGGVHVAYSYCASSDPRVHFGLGTSDGVEQVRVRWLDGTTETFGEFQADREIVLRKGAGELVL